MAEHSKYWAGKPFGIPERDFIYHKTMISSLGCDRYGTRSGCLVTSYRNNDLCNEGVEILQEKFKKVFFTRIKWTPIVSKSTFAGVPVIEFSPRCGAAGSYREFVEEYEREVRKNMKVNTTVCWMHWSCFGKRWQQKGARLIGTTAKELLDDQQKRFFRLKQKEQDNSTTADAKANFHREPYMGMYRKQERCGKDFE